MGFLDKMRGMAAAKQGADAAEHASSASSAAGSATDPVCHMKVDPAKAAGKSEHAGEAYYFCSPGCKQKFDADPHKFLGAHSH
jgi:Cu+-exporting ATPase